MQVCLYLNSMLTLSIFQGTPTKNETPSKVGDAKGDKENIFPTFPEEKQIDKTSIVNETFEVKPVCNPSSNTDLSDKYSSIAKLDDENEVEKWQERTTVITKTDHECYVAAASSILQEVLLDVKTPVKRYRKILISIERV